MEFIPLGDENVEESDVLDVFARYAELNGGKIACKTASMLLISTLQCAEQTGEYRAEFSKGTVVATITKT